MSVGLHIRDLKSPNGTHRNANVERLFKTQLYSRDHILGIADEHIPSIDSGQKMLGSMDGICLPLHNHHDRTMAYDTPGIIREAAPNELCPDLSKLSRFKLGTKYARAIFTLLAAHPDGISDQELADAIGVPVGDIWGYYTLDIPRRGVGVERLSNGNVRAILPNGFFIS